MKLTKRERLLVEESIEYVALNNTDDECVIDNIAQHTIKPLLAIIERLLKATERTG